LALGAAVYAAAIALFARRRIGELIDLVKGLRS
jgi:hypothetical protein